MALLDVRPVYVVQCRDTGAFVDINMQFVMMLKNAAQIDSSQIAKEHIRDAIYDGVLDFPEGFDVFEMYFPKDRFDR